MTYEFRAIEARWQRYWDEHRTFAAEIDPERPKYYVLDMFPYPSGDGLHVGHPEGYTATDIVARYKRMRGYNVLHPMGWDAFGLPAERHAMKYGVHPAARTAECIVNFKRQLKSLGFSYDWEREIDTTDPRYFKWTQWIFLQIYESFYDAEAGRARPIAELPIPPEVSAAGEAAVRAYRDARRLAYLHDAPVNWCPELRVVLANEEVAEHVEQGYTVVRRAMRQWMMRITAYAERLLADLEGLEWPTSVLEMQRNWIGRSEGAEVDFQLAEGAGFEGKLTVFTTRPDTLFGATYMVLAPEHPLVAAITAPERRDAVDAYVARAATRSERDRQAEAAEGNKTGEFTGAFAINPVNKQRIPIWISDYVLMGYGTGAIMAVPGHDERDHAFATAFGLPIVEVVSGGDRPIAEAPFVGDGVAVNSGLLDGLATPEAKRTMIAWLEEHGLGTRRVTYKLRDWLFSRQRYWGEPFPLVHGEDGAVFPVSDAELPVPLPTIDDYQPSESGEPPLAKAEAWRRYDGPAGRGLREVNTMPQWAGSCWYYLRFMDPSNDAAPFSKRAADYWLPVDLYIGGAEHAVLHLLYSRFWHKVLFDLGHVGTREPFQKLVNQGMVLGATYHPLDARKDEQGKPVLFLPDLVELVPGGDQWRVKATGEPVRVQWDKMSKSRGNVVNPDDVVRQYGADTMRLYEMFMGPLEHSAPWQTDGVAGCFRFLQRVHRLAFETGEMAAGEGSDRQRRLLHKTIAAVTERIDRLAFNTAISAMMVYVRDIAQPDEPLPRDSLEQFVLLLAPFAPHLAEEIWRSLGHVRSLAHEPWPAADDAWLTEDTFPLVVQIGGKRRAELQVAVGISEAEVVQLVMNSSELARYLEGKTPRRVVYVPGKLVNVVL
ncbi:leucine--tRNA ligase [Nannocystis punicea]|uniref:Leucine--tRNA ligase n=1 Tax=Nannocystis punicea TaxID=2995304 RepID=A0ABY7HAM2_9BACT|nr:leucine--tRNA ligase [Nannocystis poenicansa]WAS96170.1 leucine--tRNA ligase [Nannocystis poenicansa]